MMYRFKEVAAEYDFGRAAIGYRVRYILIRSLLLRLPKQATLVLDLGCGTGEYAFLMDRMGFVVCGIDVSKEMLLVTDSKKRKPSCISDRLQLIRAEGSRLPFKDESFDVVTCISVLDLNPFYWMLLKEISRVLKLRGKLIICIDSLWSPSRICTSMREFIGRGKKTKNAPEVLHFINLTNSMKTTGFIIEKFLGDFLLGQIITPFLFNPKRSVVAKKLFKVTRPLDKYLTLTPLLKLFSAHYIIQARKGTD